MAVRDPVKVLTEEGWRGLLDRGNSMRSEALWPVPTPMTRRSMWSFVIIDVLQSNRSMHQQGETAQQEQPRGRSNCFRQVVFIIKE